MEFKRASFNLKIVLILSVIQSVLILFVSATGLTNPALYALETPNWRTQALGQDAVDLMLVTPLLLISTVFSFRGRLKALGLWAGIMLYCTYTFVLYCFDVHFNQMFLAWCACLGLSFYSVLYFTVHALSNFKVTLNEKGKTVARVSGIYFIIISILFIFLWLSEIIPALMKGEVPASLVETGLFTNGVHVLDLSVILPGILVTGIALIRNRNTGYIMTPVLLSFFILMDVTIGILAWVMEWQGVAQGGSVRYVMAALAIVSIVFLWRFNSSVKITTA